MTYIYLYGYFIWKIIKLYLYCVTTPMYVRVGFLKTFLYIYKNTDNSKTKILILAISSHLKIKKRYFHHFFGTGIEKGGE